ncbi:MAG: O-antigen ligase family protein [Bacteroidia bacterium]|nr:O-antigen ligase family protein [Bacteroidia bacterium]MCF8426073.1 O-antigen ligase family protein [Bacteroidia bacterium]MCF8446358.1 O-antigen ligase family protein [Bacteroidia bacterium]
MAKAVSNKLAKDGIALLGFLIIALILGYTIGKGQILTAGFYIALPFVVGFFIWLFHDPKIGLLSVFHFSFVANGMSRFVPGEIPWGLVIDGLLILTVIATIFKVSKEDSKRMNNPIFFITLVWFIYTMLMVANPEARSKEAWFYAVRGLSMYSMEMIPLILILMNKKEDLDQLIRLWFIWSFTSAMYGFKMDIFGVTAGERQWLDNGGSITHEIQGRLRIFSFYSDAGQFGAAMAHTTISAFLLAIGPFPKRQRYMYWALVAICFWGFALSGSRGPLFVMAAGGFLYLFLIGNVRILIIGAAIGGILFGILKFTHVGDSNYQIHRMRTGLDPNDASLQVRIDNQKKLAVYLATRPFGGGIGSGGSWGQRFTPGSFLAEVALDSWYVKIWVETGIVGLFLHLVSLIGILIIGCIKVFNLKNPELRQKIIALICGYFGIVVASYGNQILGQLPTGAVIYFSMVYMFLSDTWDKEITREKALAEGDDALLAPIEEVEKPGRVVVRIS